MNVKVIAECPVFPVEHYFPAIHALLSLPRVPWLLGRTRVVAALVLLSSVPLDC